MNNDLLRQVQRTFQSNPVVVGPGAIARLIGTVSFVGTFASFIGLTQSYADSLRSTVFGACLVATLVLGVACFVLGEAIARVAIHGALAAGSVGVASVVAVHDSSQEALTTAFFVMNVTVCSGFFLWRTALAHFIVANSLVTASLMTFHPQLQYETLLLNIFSANLLFVVGVATRLAGSANVDGLTGLVDRAGLEEAADALHRGGDRAMYVLILDINDMQTINDELGLAGGDRVLRTAAQAWGQAIPSHGILARIGGDDFAVLIPDSDDDHVLGVSAALRRSTPGIGFACGATPWHREETINSVLRRATAALDQAKSSDRSKTVVYPAPNRELLIALREAVVDGDIAIAFQPLVSLGSHRDIVAVEALARWTDKSGVSHPPLEFIPMAEEQGLMGVLGHHIRRSSMGQMQRVRLELGIDLMLFVNTSGQELASPNFAVETLELLAETGFPPELLVLEVTETTVAAQADVAAEALAELRSHGVRVAIDDFGTGYSCLARLSGLPVDVLKLDRDFLRGINEGLPTPLLNAVASIGRALNLPLVAEGIEEPAEESRVSELGYAFGQGWLYHKAMPVAELLDVLRIEKVTPLSSVTSVPPQSPHADR